MWNKYTLAGLIVFPLMVSAQGQYYGQDKLRPLFRADPATSIISLPGNITCPTDRIQDSLFYSIADHSASTRLLLRTDNGIGANMAYGPYGQRSNTGIEPYDPYFAYTGTYSWNYTTRLYTSPSRKYNTYAGRFLSRDPQRSDYSDYNFNHANPIRYRDMDGANPVDEIVQQIRENEDFKKLGTLFSTTRYERDNRLTVFAPVDHQDPFYQAQLKKLGSLRDEVLYKKRQRMDGIKTWEEISREFIADKTFKSIVYKHGVANCGECSDIMMGVLSDIYPQFNIESVGLQMKDGADIIREQMANPTLEMTSINHAFNILNRDFSTDLNTPSSWAGNTVIIDAWAQKVFTREAFIVEYYQKRNPYYNFPAVHPKATLAQKRQWQANVMPSAQASGAQAISRSAVPEDIFSDDFEDFFPD